MKEYDRDTRLSDYFNLKIKTDINNSNRKNSSHSEYLAFPSLSPDTTYCVRSIGALFASPSAGGDSAPFFSSTTGSSTTSSIKPCAGSGFAFSVPAVASDPFPLFRKPEQTGSVSCFSYETSREVHLTFELLIVLFLPLLISSADSRQFGVDSGSVFTTIMSVPSLKGALRPRKRTTHRMRF